MSLPQLVTYFLCLITMSSSITRQQILTSEPTKVDNSVIVSPHSAPVLFRTVVGTAYESVPDDRFLLYRLPMFQKAIHPWNYHITRVAPAAVTHCRLGSHAVMSAFILLRYISGHFDPVLECGIERMEDVTLPQEKRGASDPLRCHCA